MLGGGAISRAATSAMVQAASRVCDQIQARLAVIISRSGATARIKAKHRSGIETIAVSESAAVLRQLSLMWGITPLAGADLERLLESLPVLPKPSGQGGQKPGVVVSEVLETRRA